MKDGGRGAEWLETIPYVPCAAGRGGQ